MASKHRTDDQDPDYLDNGTPRKRQRLIEEGAKEATVKRIETIIRQQFGVEMKKKEQEIELIDQRIHQVRSMLDRLRACVVATYYGMPGQQPNGEKQPSTNEKSSLHPAVKKVLGQSTGIQSSVAEQPCDSAYSVTMETSNTDMTGDIIKQVNSDEEEKMETEDKDNLVTKVTGVKGPRNQGNDTFGIVPRSLSPQSVSSLSSGPSRFHVKKRIVVGNISKYIAPDKREENDPSTHKWMVYVRGPLEEPRIDHFVKKVWFFLHPSYRPNDLVEVSEPPFHLTRRGWGEFPVRVQLHFLDQRNKKVDIIHNLKLDRTYTGLQTLGAETVVDVELDRYSVEDHDSGEAKAATQENETEGKVESGMKEVTIQHSDSQGLKSADETEDASGVAATQAPTAAQITARIAAAQQLCSPKTKTAVQAATKLQASSVNESQSQIAQNGSKLISKAITATGTLSMPPLGPISCTKGNSNNAVSGTAITTTVIPQPSQAKVNPVRSVNTSGSFVMLSSQTSPTTGSVAVTTATSGAMTTKVRINQGKVEMSGQSTGAGLSSTSNIPQSKSDNTVVSPLPSQSSAVVKLTPSLSLPRSTVATTARSATPGVKMEVTSPPCKVKGQASIITSPQPRPQVAMPTAIAMPAGVTMTAPGVTMGTQYFIAAKSTDPNLQGKMILIPHQALVQATGQRLVAPVTQATGQRLVAPVSQTTAQRLVAPVSQGAGQRLVAPVSQQITSQAVRPRGGANQIQRLTAPSQITAGKATTGIPRIATTVQGKGQSPQVRSQTPQSRGQTVQVRGAFPIPPGNVILIPQGANIPGIHPGSIVQIQQTMPVSKPQTLAAKTAQTGTQRVMMSPPAVTKTTVQLSPASSLPSSASTVALSAQSPTSVLAKTAVNVGNQATTAVNVGNQATATVGSQATTAVAIGNQARASMGGSVTTIIKQVSPSLTPSSSSVTNVVAKTVVTPSTSKPIGTKLVLTKPVVHAIKPVSANADDAEDTDQKTTPQVIKLTKTSFLRPTSSSIATLEHAATSKVSMSTVPIAKVTAAVKPTTTIIGPRLPMDTVAKKLETGCLATASTINIDHVTSFEELVCHLVKRNPMIKKDRVQQEAPFCVTSVEQYRGWHIGKQRSAEWQRAAKVRKTLQEIVKLSEKWTDQDVWSVKSIMIWCRRHGYSIPDEANSQQILCDVCGEMKSERPIPDEKEKSDESFDGKCEKTVDTDKTGSKDEDISMHDDADDDEEEEEEDEDEEEEDDDDDDDDDENESEEDEDEEDIEDHKCKQEMLSDNGWLSTTSLTTCDSLCKEIEQRQSALQEDKNDYVDIDVVGVDENKITVKTEVQESSGAIQMYLPSTLHAEFVKNSCEEVGVKLPATEIAKDTYAPVMEEVLLAAMVEFMNDLMRDALAVAHGNRTDNRCPGEILPIHVYQSIVKNPKYSFLTNKHLGVVAMETGDANQPV